MDNNKIQELKKYSDPVEVAKIAKRYDLEVFPSTRKDKKYMIKLDDNKVVHFGQMLYKDYTLTKDDKKRDAFRARNHKWASANKTTAAWLSYHLLW